MAAPLLTPNDVADLCQINPKTVIRAIRSGRLAAARLARGARPGSPRTMSTHG